MKCMSVVLACVLTLGSVSAEAAKRLGGGKSMGQQSSQVTKRDAEAPPAASPAAAQAATAAKPAAAGAAAAAPRKPWGAMLGGLAAGLGLAWLAHSLGLGEAFGQFLLIALLVGVVMLVVGLVLRARRSSNQPSSAPLAFQGAGAGADVPTPKQYSPEHVGNDASARPWERNSMAFEAGKLSAQAGGLGIGSALAGGQGWGVPADFDRQGFLESARRHFVTLQDAWDRADIATLRSMMTDSMLAEVQSQLNERETHSGGQTNKTDVVMLEAQLLGIEDLGDAYMASVEFSGMIREEPSAGPSPFREVWNMTKPRNGNSGWLVAGLQALQ